MSFNPKLLGIEPSVIRAIAAKKKPGDVDLGLGEPTLLPQARFLEAATRWAIANGVKYTVNAGDLATRETIAAHYGYPGMSEGRNVCMTTGSQEAAYCTIKAGLDPARDALLIVEPAFPAYGKMAQLEGITVQRVGMPAEDAFRYDVDAILSAMTPQTRMIVIASPANPTGRVLKRDDAQRLAPALLARGGEPVWVLFDEIYRELTFVDDAGNMAEVYPYTIAVNSLSKSNALTGMRIGWTIAPAPFCDEIVRAHAWVTSTASAFAQRIALEIFSEPGALSEQADWYRTQRAAVLDALDDSGLDYISPDGAFYACVRMPHGRTDSVAEAHRLVDEAHVVAIPGRIFGPTLEGYLRLSWVAPIASIRDGLQRIAAEVLTAR